MAESRLRWCLSLAKHALLTLNTRRRQEALKVLIRRLLQAQDDTSRRVLFWEQLEQVLDVVTFRRDGLVWTGPVRSLVTRILYETGQHSVEPLPDLLSWLGSRSPRWASTAVVINVGANIGDTAIPLARATGKRVIACEPGLEAFPYLRRNVEDNGVGEQVACRNVAVSARCGRLRMVLSTDPSQSEIESATGRQAYIPSSRGTTEVEAITLDELCKAEGLAPGDVGFVWSDTQGHEAAVLEGGSRLWAAGVPAWVEFWPQGLEAQGGLAHFMKVCGRFFTGYLLSSGLTSDSLRPVETLESLAATLPGTAGRDILLVP